MKTDEENVENVDYVTTTETDEDFSLDVKDVDYLTTTETDEDFSLGVKGVDYLKPNTLDEETKNRIGFITFIIEKFASGYKMNRRDAYLYLEKYGGLDYIFENWWALHIDNPFWALRDIYKVCRHNGGLK